MDGSIWTILPLSLAAIRPKTVICVVVPSMYYTVSGILYHKSTESMYTCTLVGVFSIYTQPLYVCIFGQQVHGIVYSVYHVAI